MFNLDVHYTVDMAAVGLNEKHPVRLSTLHYGAAAPPIPPGDLPNADELQSLRIFKPESDEVCNISAHKHAFYEIVFIRKGCGLHHSRLGTVHLQRGDVFVLTPDGVHAYENIRGAIKTNMYLQPAWLFEDLRPLWTEEGLVRYLLADALFGLRVREGTFHLRSLPKEADEWEHEIDALELEAAKPIPSLSYFNGCFLKILGILNRAFTRDAHEASLPLDSLVWKAAGIVERLIAAGEPLDLDQLSRQAGVSPIHFSRLFRESTGQSPMNYYQARRIQHAAQALLNLNASVTDVAHKLGFADSSHFARMFKRNMGESPKQYRQRMLSTQADR